jgi:hypothetical protein
MQYTKIINTLRVQIENDRCPVVTIPVAYGFEIDGIQFALHKAIDLREPDKVTKRSLWAVSEVTTGLQVHKERIERRKEFAVEGAEHFVKRYGSERLKREIREGVYDR